MKSERRMVRINVREANISGQVFCTRQIVDICTLGVHPAGMDDDDDDDDDNNEPLSKHYLLAWRRYRKLTQQELGRRIGRAHSVVGRMERSEIALTQRMLDKLARALHTSRGNILDRPPPSGKSARR